MESMSIFYLYTYFFENFSKKDSVSMSRNNVLFGVVYSGARVPA